MKIFRKIIVSFVFKISIKRISMISLWKTVKMAKFFPSLYSHHWKLILQVLTQKARFISPWSWICVGHLTCFGQWDINKYNISWGLKRSCLLKSALLLNLELWDHHGNESKPVCWRMRNQMEALRSTACQPLPADPP